MAEERFLTPKLKLLLAALMLLGINHVSINYFDFNLIYLFLKDPNPSIVWQPLEVVEFEEQGEEFLKGLAHYNKEEFDRAIAIWTPLAENGHAEAAYRLGRMYDFGWGTEQDFRMAFKWFEIAATANQLNGIVSLGYMKYNGLGTHRNTKEACQLYRRALEMGSPVGAFNYGTCFQNAVFGPRDTAKAIFLYEKSAKDGCCNAYQALGKHYGFEDNGIKVNKEKAYRYLKLAQLNGCDNELHRFLVSLYLSSETTDRIDAEVSNR